VQKSNVWQKFLEHTPDNQINKSNANCCAKRTAEAFMSGRTLNPNMYSNEANLLMFGNEK